MGGGVLTTGAFIDGERFRLIVDTGSPYLVVPLEEKCAAQSPRLSYYGCASPGRFRAAGFPPTSEQYGALPGRVRWLKGGVRFGDAQPEREYAAVFGAADRAVMSQSGGALLGLIRQVSTQPGSTIPREDLRPTALAQLGVSSFSLDAPRRRLTLSSEPLLGEKEDALPLVDPRPFGDGVEHVCIRVEGDAIAVNGATRVARRPVLCVLDSGLSGCVLSQSLADELSLGGGPLESLEVAVRTESGRRVVLGSSRRQSSLFYAQQIPLNWFSDRSSGPHVVALGQCVLQGGALTVDGATRRATWAPA